MKQGFAVLMMFLSQTLCGQNVQPTNLDEVYSRIESGGDTTYIINFWATWCVPCIEELPSFEKLARNKKTSKVKILLVSVDFRSKLETVVVPFVRKHGLTNEVWLLDETNQDQYITRIDSTWSGALPATLFVYKNKRKFFEKQMTYIELLTELKSFRKL